MSDDEYTSLHGCEHPDDEVKVRLSTSWQGGGDFYCTACGQTWIASQEEIDAYWKRVTCPAPRTLEDVEEENRQLREIVDLAREFSNFDMETDGGVREWTERASRLAVAVAKSGART